MAPPIVMLRGVSERDVDLLLVEELSASQEFRMWFEKQANVARDSTLEEISRSVISSSGESDLELIYRGPDGTTKILVENKIDAMLQPRQSERYAARGRAYVEAGDCERVSTVLIAPDSYSAGSHGFDARISYESLREWFEKRTAVDSRARYKLELLRRAIERGKQGWTMVPDEAVSDFWVQYWRVVSDVAPQLQMPKPGGKPATSGFIRFLPASLGRGVQLIHKAPYGNVDLQFADMQKRAAEFVAEHRSKLEPDMHIAAASKSLVVRIAVQRVTLETPFQNSESSVRDAVSAAARLLAWYERYVAASMSNTTSIPE
jgi:hypothetical protein